MLASPNTGVVSLTTPRFECRVAMVSLFGIDKSFSTSSRMKGNILDAVVFVRHVAAGAASIRA